MSRHQFETPVSTERTIRDRIIDPRGVFLRFLQIVIRFSVILLGTLLFGGGIIWLFNWLHPPGGIVVDTPLKVILFFLHLPVVLLLLVVCAIGVTLLIMWRISRPLAIRAYLQAVRKEEERYARVYVHLSALENIYKTPVKYGQNTNGKDLLEVVEQHQDRHLLFLGLPGAGKTTALHACQHHALHKQEKNKKIPLFIPMNSYSAFLDTITSIPEKTLLPYLHYESSLSESKVKGIHHLARYLEQLLQQGRLLLLCDGLNELNSAYLETVCAELMGLMRANQNRLVMTCREFDYHEQEVFQRLVGEECAEGVTIPPLGLDDIRKFVTSYIEAKDGEVQWNITVEYVMSRIEGTPLLYHCTNPLMLSILMQTLNEEDAQIGGQINTRGRLLEIFVLRLVERELARPKWVARRLPEDFRDNVLMFLSEIAWTARRVNRRNGIQLSNPRSISGGVRRTPSRRELIDDLMNWLAEPDPRREEPLLTYEDLGLEQLHDSYRPEQVAQFLEFAQNAELITLSPQGLLSFRHEVIEEYLVAEHIFELDKHNQSSIPFGQELLAATSSWVVPISLWAGMLDDPMKLAQRLAELGQYSPQEDSKDALILSLMCVGVTWTSPQNQQQPRIILPPGVEELLAKCLPEQETRIELARILYQCAKEGGLEVYRSLLRLLEKRIRFSDDLLFRLFLLDPSSVSAVLFEYLCAIVDGDVYADQKKLVVRLLGRCGEVSRVGEDVIRRAIELSTPGRSIPLRIAAMEILGCTHSQQAVEPLAIYLNDPDQHIVNGVVSPLAWVGPELALDRVMMELNSHRHIYRAGLTVLRGFLDERITGRPVSLVQHQRIVNAIVSLLHSKYPHAAQQEAKSILLSQVSPTVDEQNTRGKRVIQSLIQALEHDDASLVQNAIALLKRVGKNATQPLLLQLRQNPPEIVQQRIIEVLGDVRNMDALRPLLSYVGVAPPMVQRQVDIALQNYKPHSISPLIETVLSHASQRVASNAARILQEIGEMAVEPVSQNVLPIVSGRTELLVKALVHIGDTRALPSLIALLKAAQTDTDLAVIVIQALSHFPEKEVVLPLLEVLAHPVPSLTREASRALAQVGKVAVPYLITALDLEQETGATTEVRNALLGMATFPAEELLSVFANGSEAQAKQVRTVFRLKGKDAADFLVPHLLFHTEKGVRSQVRQTLQEMQPQDIREPLLMALKYHDQRLVIAEYLLKDQDSIRHLVMRLGDVERSQPAFDTLLDFGSGLLHSLVDGLNDSNPMIQSRTRDIIEIFVDREPKTLPERVVGLFALLNPPDRYGNAYKILVEMLAHKLANLCIPALLDGLGKASLKKGSVEVLVQIVRQHDTQSDVARKGLLDALRMEARRDGTRSALIELGGEVVEDVGTFIIDADHNVALAAQNILSAIGAPAFHFIWTRYRDNRYQKAVQHVFDNMKTSDIKDKLIDLLLSGQAHDVEMAQSLLSMRIRREERDPLTQQEMIPALLDRLQVHGAANTNLHILAFLLLQRRSAVIRHMVNALYKPNHQEWLVHAFLLFDIEGSEARDALHKVLEDPRTSAKLFAEVVAVLAMMDLDMGRYASTVGDYGLYANYGSYTNRATRVLYAQRNQFEQLEIAQRALGGLLASGKWDSAKLEELRNKSQDGSAEHELYSILLGERYRPVIAELEEKLEKERAAHEQEVSALSRTIATRDEKILDLEEEVRVMHSRAGAHARERQDLLGKISNKERRIQVLEQQVTERDSRLSAQKNLSESLTKKNADLEANHSSLQAQLNALRRRSRFPPS